MCGIVGYVGKGGATKVVISGLSKLEYRGYDSAGIAVYDRGEVRVFRAEGKLVNLRKIVEAQAFSAEDSLAIGHTRWATHGRPSETNAHPHTVGRVSLIHNGIIENYSELKRDLQKRGASFKSDTDTEIAACLLNEKLETGLSPLDAMRALCREVKGSYAFLAIDAKHPDRIIVAKNSTPIIIGVGAEDYFIASDVPAILEYTRDIQVLEDGDIAEIKRNSLYIENKGIEVKRPTRRITWDPITAQKGGFKHYMLKEIFDQPEALADAFRGRLKPDSGEIFFEELPIKAEEIADINRIILVGCGTAWHACLLAKFYFEKFAKIACEVDYASEFRYRDKVIAPGTLVIAISQSGETADTIGAIESVLGLAKTLAICNVLGSSLTRKTDYVVYTQAGPEISVASTKAFSSQVVLAYLLALYFADKRRVVTSDFIKEQLHDLLKLPSSIQAILKQSETVEKLSKNYSSARDFLYLGRGPCYPIALEGALKLKEISYIHAEGYPAGEMKHGPIALIDSKLPVVMLLQKSPSLLDKVMSGLREVESRGANIIAVTDVEDVGGFSEYCNAVVQVPFVNEWLSPILLGVPLQLLAYYVAVQNGTDVDLPRNLAKSVTVE